MKCCFKYFDEFINSVFYTDTDRFFQMVEDGCFSGMLTHDTNILSDVLFPIHYITICWDIILSKYDEYKDKYKQQAYIKKCKNDRIKDFFNTYYQLDMEYIAFQDYADYFYCEPADATVEDCIGWAQEELKKMRYRQKDIDLLCCVEKFDYENVERLLKEGANPHKSFCGETDCFDRIETECAFLNIELRDAIFNETANKKVSEEDISILIGLAAHEKMYSLLKKFDQYAK